MSERESAADRADERAGTDRTEAAEADDAAEATGEAAAVRAEAGHIEVTVEEADPSGGAAGYEDGFDDEPAPMPAEGQVAVVAVWLFATALCGCFMIAAFILVFELSDEAYRTDGIARSVGYCALFGALTAVHVVVALQLREARHWARYAVVVLQMGAIACCAYLIALPFRDAGVSIQIAGGGLLGIVFCLGVIALVCARGMRQWCDGTLERPDPGGPGRSRLLR